MWCLTFTTTAGARVEISRLFESFTQMDAYLTANKVSQFSCKFIQKGVTNA